ncbi:hypothetical protein C0993_007511 [Termitomyces sp. T159_Od127]|nr:hypothetical protein C0993_007511 [Termitomyces sp. T159_Od127]
MEQEAGDTYLRRLASFIRANEKNLAEAGFYRRRRTQHPSTDSASLYNPLSWFSSDSSGQSTTPKPVVLSLDIHRLFYVLMRLEALGLDVGTLDVQVDNPSRPMSYINIFTDSDKSDTLSLASFRSSLSAVSNLSLGSGWWGRPEPPSVDSELKYIYSSFTKIPALSVNAPGRKVIAELSNDSANQNALPLDAFKNLQKLECVDIDPRTLLGWDKLAESLVSLKIKKSGLEDMTDIFVGAVIDDQARREGSTSRKRQRRIPHGLASDPSFFSTRLPESVPEDADAEESAGINESSDFQPHQDSGSASPVPLVELPSSKWAFLKSLSLSDNSLTFFPSGALPYLTNLSHLDLSSNLLVSVPPGLGALYNLVSLNLADNMIDSVLGIYLNLGQVLTLNIAHNRLESICGLERLAALERIDLRGNLIEESAEVGRLAVLPNISEIWVEGNPLVEIEESYRVACFDYFWKEKKTIKLDGTPPGFYERRNLTVLPSEQMTSSRNTTVPSPPVVAVGHKHAHHQTPPQQSSVLDTKYPTPPSSNASPSLGAIVVASKIRQKKPKRIVELDIKSSNASSPIASTSHSRNRSTASTITKPTAKVKTKKTIEPKEPPSGGERGQIESVDVDGEPSSSTRPYLFVEEPTPIEQAPASSTAIYPQPKKSSENSKMARGTRRGRYHTDFTPSSTSFDLPDSPTSPAKPPSLKESSSISLGLTSQAAGRKATAASRARAGASVFDKPVHSEGEEGSDGGEDMKDNGDAFRRRIEALKKDMGDSWLKVYSQSQIKAQNS